MTGASVGDDCLEAAMRWIAHSVETEALMRELEEATSRISGLVGAVKQYSAMDRAPYGDVDVPAGLDSTLVMLSHTVGPGIVVERGYEPGVPPDALDRIFEAFFTTKAAGRGTGLGLDIARRIVEIRHSRRLTVTSRPGETRFRVRLPLRPALQEALPPAAPAP